MSEILLPVRIPPHEVVLVKDRSVCTLLSALRSIF